MLVSPRISTIVVVCALLAGLTGAIQPSTSVQGSLAEVQTGVSAKTSVLPPAPANGAAFTDNELFMYNPTVGLEKVSNFFTGNHQFRVPAAVTWPIGAENAMPPAPVQYGANLVLYHGTDVDLVDAGSKEVRFWRQPTWFAVRLGTSVAHMMAFRWDPANLPNPDVTFYLYEFHSTRPLNLIPNPPNAARYDARLSYLFHLPPRVVKQYMGAASPIADMAGSRFCQGFLPSHLQAIDARLGRRASQPDPRIVLPRNPVSYEGWRSPWDQNEVMLCPTSVLVGIQSRSQFKCSTQKICDAIEIIPAGAQQARSASIRECKDMFVDGDITVGRAPNGNPIQGYDADIDHANVHRLRRARGNRPATTYQLGPKTPTVTLHGNVVIDLDTIIRNVCDKTKIKSHTIALV